ncbi:hypothetical protein RND59_00650 [Vibrio ruber]|uniref:hypothetical protein n=1 Tax=Vibrio ruber TaxID=184755 RepID=UPI00289311DF|nr:hypothetical protein [Vibrio ruber]WNJ95666.1 hypothetical protein RND59_00650 [Vibrio ruber]
MKLRVSSNDDEVFLFERVVKHLQLSYGYPHDEAIVLINEYYLKFTDKDYCDKYDISVQTMDFFGHIEARGMADRVHYYQGLKHEPDEAEFIKWQRNVRM